MLATIYSQLVALCVAAFANILMGIYNNINLEQCNFNFKKLLTGVIKAVIIILTFIAIGYCFDVTDLSSIGVTPDLVINSAIILYVGKALQNLMKILGVTTLNNNITKKNEKKDINFKDSVG